MAAVACATDRVGAAVISNTVGTYDATTNANTVDSTATGSTGTVATFTPLVASAHAANQGGVVNFELSNYIPATDPASDSNYTFNFGVDATHSLGMTTSVNIDPVPSVSTSTGTIVPISGNGVLANQTTGADIRFTFAPSAGHRLTDVAFTLLGRTSYSTAQTFDATATFSGGGTQVASATIGNVKGSTDTFFWFQAPAGETISNVLVDNVSGSVISNPVFDDLAFVAVVPEPASLGLIGMIAAGLLARRRW